jgi:S-disulfanyl-L-cysteine oxidoreductase SoxD
MYNLNKFFIPLAVFLLVTFSSFAIAEKIGHYGVGKTASEQQIKGWDIDIRPDGKGLPKGQGSVTQGEPLYEAKCASCHGSFGEGQGRWPILAGGEDSLTEERPEKTVGSFWPYASTLWDYINRAMPYTAPKSLTPDEVYAISAYVLYLNEIVEDDFVLTDSNLASVKMPNEENFYIDDRPDSTNTRCMKNCKNPADIEVVQPLADITPEQEKAPVKEISKNTSSLSELAIQGKATYQSSCFVCHSSGVAGAPKVSDKDDWNKRIEKGFDQVVTHAIDGYSGNTGIMPPKGGNLSLSDEQVTNAVHYMLEAK